jgi:hypothetical protein
MCFLLFQGMAALLFNHIEAAALHHGGGCMSLQCMMTVPHVQHEGSVAAHCCTLP